MRSFFYGILFSWHPVKSFCVHTLLLLHATLQYTYINIFKISHDLHLIGGSSSSTSQSVDKQHKKKGKQQKQQQQEDDGTKPTTVSRT